MTDFAGAEILQWLGTQNIGPKASLCPKLPFIPLVTQEQRDGCATSLRIWFCALTPWISSNQFLCDINRNHWDSLGQSFRWHGLDNIWTAHAVFFFSRAVFMTWKFRIKPKVCSFHLSALLMLCGSAFHSWKCPELGQNKPLILHSFHLISINKEISPSSRSGYQYLVQWNAWRISSGQK